jgi:hypothetical protein
MRTRLSLFAVVFASAFFARAASAADLAGDWTLNIPNDPSTWTFTQETPSSLNFTATTTVYQGPFYRRYDLSPGVTFGPLVLALETLSIQGAPAVPAGLLIATSSAGTLTGTLFALDGSTTPVTGEKVVARAPKARK